MDRKQVVVIGDIFLDMTADIADFPERGGRAYGTPLSKSGGGTAGNIASGLSKLGIETLLSGALGNDAEGQYLLEHLREDGVNTDHSIMKDDFSSGVVVVIRDDAGERTIYVLVKDSAFENLTMDDLSFMEEISPSSLCLTGTVAGTGTSAKTVIEIAKRWKNRTPIYFDPNLCYPVNAIPEEVVKETRILADFSDVVLTGEAEKSALGLEPTEHQLYIVKCGERGSYLIRGKEKLYSVPATTFPAVDTTGAGDNYMAAFVAARLKEMSIEEAMCFASVAAGLSVTRSGARSMPAEAEVLELLDAYKAENHL